MPYDGEGEDSFFLVLCLKARSELLKKPHGKDYTRWIAFASPVVFRERNLYFVQGAGDSLATLRKGHCGPLMKIMRLGFGEDDYN